MASKESYKDRQENELEVLKSIFGDDVIDLREKDAKWEGLNLKIKLEPQRDSRVSETFCKLILCIKCPKNYPKVTPIVTFEGVKGLSNTDKETLLNQIKKEAYGLKGEVMIFELCQLVQSFLHERNVPPKGSFYDEMLANKQKRDQDELTQQKEKEEKLRQQLQDEVLKRKEQIRKEHRIRRTTVNESPMRNISSESSNSESRFYVEACDEHKRTENIYFPIEGRKILQGACIGHSLKGCINFSGIDLATGRLYYLTEWTIKYSQLEIKNFKVDEVIDTIEKKVAILSKLRHKNLVAYDGVLCTRKKDSIVVTLVQDFLFGISVCNMSTCWNWSAECVSSISKNVLESLVFLHNNGVSHGNLIDSTVFTDSAGNIKVSDYSIVPYLQELTTGVLPSPDLPSLGSLIESLMPTPHLEMKNFISECKSERTLSASDLLEHPFLYPVQMGHDDSLSPENQKLMLSCPPPVAERVQTNINMPIVIAPLISSNHSRLETEFELINHIGRGAYGDVLKVRNNLDNRLYAIKRIPLSSKNKQLFKKMTREVELLSRLNHENVVRYFNSWIETQTTPIPELEGSDEDGDYSHNGRKIVKTHSQNRLPVINSSSSEDEDSLGLGWNGIDSDSSSESEDDGIEFVDSQGRVVNYDDENESIQDNPPSDSRVKETRKYTILYIQMEFCEKSTLRSAIDDSNLYQNKERYWKLFREIVEGLSHIHQQGMIHRDLKCENIFLDSRDHVKIGDFGLATTSVLALQNQHTDLNQTLKPPQLTYSDSHTGLVGTALYVAPELTGKASKSVYNQKVDLYSLGVIFFEMIMPPLQTGMERIQTLLNIRKPDIVLPTNLDDKDYKNEIQLLKWLLDHNISKRPTSEELLQSELLPQAKLEVSELQEMLRGVLSNPQSRNYKYLVNRLIQQESDHLLQYTYHSEIPLQISSVFENVKSKVEEIFRKHGGIDIQTPLLMPYMKTDKETVVKLMTHSGCVVTLPDDLRSLFLRYVTANGINLLRRYAIGRVFREYKMHNSHPKQTFGCEFDIVTPTRGNLLVDAELLVIAHEIISEFDVLKSKDIMFKINHTSLIRAIFLYYSVPTPKYKNILGLIKEFKEEKISKFQLQSAATTLLVAIKPQAINSLMETLLIDVEMSNISSTNLRTLIKGRGEAASLCKGALRELETVANLSQALGVTIPIHLCVSLSLNYDCSLSGNIVWEMVGKLKKKGKEYPLATGGRYDHEIENYKKWSQKNSSTFVNRESYCAGMTFHIDRLVGSLKMLSDTNSYRAVVDLVVYVTGSRPPLKDVCHILKTLWNAGIKCYYIESQADDDIARDLGANHIIILGENGCLRIKSWQNCRYDERTVSRAEAIDYLKKNLKTELNEIEAESYNVMRNNSLTSIINENNVTVVRSFQIVFITNEKLNANKKKRLENQIEQKVSNVMLKFCKKMTFIVFAVEIDASQIRQMLTCIEPNPKDQSQNEFDNLLKGYPKTKHSYLQEIYDEITEKLMKDKNTTVAGIFGIQDSYCRIVL